MIYPFYQAMMDATDPMRRMAALTAPWLDGPSHLPREARGLRRVSAALEVMGSAATSHTRPAFGITTVRVGNRDVAVQEQVMLATPFASLLRFAKDSDIPQPKLLLVAPMSGHFATLLRGTVRTVLADHDTYITDWHNARDIPLHAGEFGFDDFVDHIIRFLEHLGPGSHVLAVCQPAVPVLAAVALMAQDNNRAQPRSMTLMAGPIDTRLNPTKVNALAKSRPMSWFEQRMISTVPWRFAGAWRRVYPGFVQLTAFVSMNLERHLKAYATYYENLVAGDTQRAAAHRNFYDEYLAVMDLPATFYLETISRVFQEHALPLGRLTWRGHAVKPQAIRRTALLTVEGELDDICAVGQTMAALDLCAGLRPAMRRHHLQTGAGHYGVFNGRRWTQEIYPRVRAMVQANSG